METHVAGKHYFREVLVGTVFATHVLVAIRPSAGVDVKWPTKVLNIIQSFVPGIWMEPKARMLD